jgi:hypothetical protein
VEASAWVSQRRRSGGTGVELKEAPEPAAEVVGGESGEGWWREMGAERAAPTSERVHGQLCGDIYCSNHLHQFENRC